tara:strand:- start:1469 stop:1732 length:264 start_codon:yes stop_codon:yes gene_type:complete
MYNDGIANEHEYAHQKGLTRGFDLGWSYKGRFDRQIIQDHIDLLEVQYNKKRDPEVKLRILAQRESLQQVYRDLKEHANNREFITDC